MTRRGRSKPALGVERVTRAVLAAGTLVALLGTTGCCTLGAALGRQDPKCGATPPAAGTAIEVCPDCAMGIPVQPSPRIAPTPRLPQHVDRVAKAVAKGTGPGPAATRAPGAASGTKPSVRSLGAGALTVGAVSLGLKDVIAQLQETLRTASTELQTIGNSLQQNAESVLAQLDTYLGQKLDYTFDRLSDQERRLAEDAESLIAQVSTATRAIASGAADVAKRTAQEADITAYDAANSLPCKNKVPRIVYVTPDTIEVNSQAASPVLTVRGNFLNYGAPEIKVGDRPARLVAVAANEYTIEVPNSTINGIRDQTALKVSAVCNKCTVSPLGSRVERTGTEQSLAVMIKPIQAYAVVARITPVADLPVEGIFECARYDHTEAKCNITNAPGTNMCNLPDKSWLYLSHELADRDINGYSRIVSEEATGQSLKIVDSVTGLGCHTPFDCSHPDPMCKGRGWVKYTPRIRYRAFNRSALATFSASEPSGQRKTFTFTYDRPLPAGAQGVEYLYDVTVNITRGSETTTVTLSDVNANYGSLVKTSMNNGKLSVEILD